MYFLRPVLNYRLKIICDMGLFLKSEPKEFKRWHLAVLAVVILSALFFRWYYNRWQSAAIEIAGNSFTVLVARTTSQQIEGWSNKDNMGGYNGMIFRYPPGIFPAMVMRKMRFPLDILWVDNGKIVDMAKNLPPDNAQREEDLFQYRPRMPATLVIEMPAGFVDKYSVKIGDSVKMAGS